VVNQRHLAATWSENKNVYIWDLTDSLCAVNSTAAMARFKQQKHSPIFTFSGHRDEGFAMDWNEIEPGFLLNSIYCEQISCGVMGIWTFPPGLFSPDE